MIPKVLHQVWVGGGGLPPDYVRKTDAWRRLHPDWEYRMWDDRAMRDTPIARLVERAYSPVCLADAMRLWAVMTFGGVYADMDFDWQHPLVLDDSCLAFSARQPDGKVNNAIFGAVAGHPWLRWQYERLPGLIGRPPPWGPSLMTDATERAGDGVTILPTEWFYPYAWNEQERADDKFPDAVAIHRFDMTWKREPPAVSITVACKGRLDQLKKTLPLMIAQTIQCEIVVCDYNCPEGTAKWVESLGFRRVLAVRVPMAPRDGFNLSHARNIAIRHATGKIIVATDADMGLAPDYAEMVRVKLNESRFAVVADDRQHHVGKTIIDKWRPIMGALVSEYKMRPVDSKGRTPLAFRKSDWMRVRGFREDITGWGYDEIDFFNRIRQLGGVVETHEDYCMSLPHDDDRRMAFFDVKNKLETNNKNKNLCKNKEDPVNPHGFGDLFIPLEAHRRMYV